MAHILVIQKRVTNFLALVKISDFVPGLKRECCTSTFIINSDSNYFNQKSRLPNKIRM